MNPDQNTTLDWCYIMSVLKGNIIFFYTKFSFLNAHNLKVKIINSSFLQLYNELKPPMVKKIISHGLTDSTQEHVMGVKGQSFLM